MRTENDETVILKLPEDSEFYNATLPSFPTVRAVRIRVGRNIHLPVENRDTAHRAFALIGCVRKNSYRQALAYKWQAQLPV